MKLYEILTFYHFQNYISFDFTYREPEISSFDSYD